MCVLVRAHRLRAKKHAHATMVSYCALCCGAIVAHLRIHYYYLISVQQLHMNVAFSQINSFFFFSFLSVCVFGVPPLFILIFIILISRFSLTHSLSLVPHIFRFSFFFLFLTLSLFLCFLPVSVSFLFLVWLFTVNFISCALLKIILYGVHRSP